jgi:predicted dehydrogenase
LKKIKAAIIGAGFIGKAHIEAIRRIGFVDIVAIAQSNQQQAEAYSSQLSIPRAYGDYMELLQDDEIDVIHNCTPNHLHFEINKQCLIHGKHLLSEKPLTMVTAEAKQLYELASNKQLVAGVNYNYRQFPMIQQLKSMIQDHDLGDVKIIRGSYLQDWLLYQTDYNWRMDPRLGGSSRALSDIGSHLFDLVQYVSGLKIEEVMGDISIIHPERLKSTAGAGHSFQNSSSEQLVPVPITTEDYCSVFVKFNNGIKGVLTVSQVAAGKKNALEIHIDGTKASATWHQEEPFILLLGHRDKARETYLRDPGQMKQPALDYVHYPGGHEEGWTDSLKNMMYNFYKAVQKGTELTHSVASIKDGYQTQLIIDAILASVQTKTWEKVKWID